MKTTFVLTVVSSLLLPGMAAASDTHDADRALESSLRTELNDRRVHFHVHEGIVDIDGKVPTDADRTRIDDMVRNTPGVVAVKDELRVTLPSPGTYGASPTAPVVVPAYPAAVPVYAEPLPGMASVPVVSEPAPVIIPGYAKLKVQAWRLQDEPVANRIARQLRADAVPTAGIQSVTIVVRDGNASLKGDVDSHQDRDAIIASIQRAGGVTAIYDQLHIK